jgi:hypothetical protein
METVMLTAKKKSDLKPLIELAKKLGMKAKSLSRSEMEDYMLAKKIEEGLKTKTVSRNSVIRALQK